MILMPSLEIIRLIYFQHRLICRTSLCCISLNPFRITNVAPLPARSLLISTAMVILMPSLATAAATTFISKTPAHLPHQPLLHPASIPSGSGKATLPARSLLSDGDGDLDAFIGMGIGNNYGNNVYFLNTGSSAAPAFAAASLNPRDHSCRPLTRPSLLISTATVISMPSLAMPTTSPWRPHLYFQNTGSSAAPAFLRSSNPFGITDVNRSKPGFADLDGDGDLDAFIGSYDGDIVYFQNTGSSAA